jgi:hypothetical protein
VSDHTSFDRIAAEAIAVGLFDADTAATRKNLLAIAQHRRHPVTLLDVPYGNGPRAIEVFQQDVPEESVYAVRHNYTEANKLLVPHDQVSQYFQERLLADDLFKSRSLGTLVDGYQAPGIDGYEATGNNALSGIRYKADDLSFRVNGVDRTTHDRYLYTRAEQVAGLQLADRQPAVVLAILLYQAVLQDYLRGIGDALSRIAQQPDSRLTRKDLTDFEGYMEPWRGSSFTHELVPALAIFQQHRVDAGIAEEQSIDRDVFATAVRFIIENGAFRNWVIVPAEVAGDHQQRITHFLCPGVGPIREQLDGGVLLWQLYRTVRQKLRRKDRNATRYAERIHAEAREKFRNKDRAPFTVTIDGETRPLQINTSFVLLMRGRQQAGDARVEAESGIRLFDLMRSVVSLSIEQNAAVFVEFKGTGYRITPERIAEFVNRASRRL